ncbi:hypothetical protein GGQ84_001001 [Desulfitispora alkaliphila]|uniref:S-layer homology domain-containing protein n=1 Tax=Desulfitispora alkaliphila TaxID=622674 RepID=UPI003D1D8D05
MKKSSRRMWLNFLVIALITIFALTGAIASNTSDIDSHWAGEVITEWIDSDLATGYPDGTFRPDNAITRAEFMVLVNKAFGYTYEKPIEYSDVSESDWFSEAVRRAQGAGYIGGYPDGTMRPNNPISRQEAATIMVKLTGLTSNADDADDADDFSDSHKMPAWSKGQIGAVVEAGYMGGYPDGSFKPAEPITRAEAIVSLDRVIKEGKTPEEGIWILDKAGTYGPAEEASIFEGDVYIKLDQVVLENVNITGDLIIAEEVGEGDVTLNNVTVKGDTYIRGGGADSIYINGGDYKNIIVQKAGGRLRIVMISDRGASVIVAQDAQNTEVIIEGIFDNINVKASNVTVTMQGKTQINDLQIDEQAKDVIINTSKETEIQLVTANTTTHVKNEGRIIKAGGTAADQSEYEINLPENLQPETQPRRPGGSSGGGSVVVPPPKQPSVAVTPNKVYMDNQFDTKFTLKISNDTVTEAVYKSHIQLGGSFDGLNLKSVGNDASTVTATVYGSLDTVGVGTITLDQEVLQKSSKGLQAEVQVLAATEALVSSEAGLKDALDNSEVETINLTKSIDLSEELNIPREVSINLLGNTIAGYGVVVTGDNVLIKDGKIEPKDNQGYRYPGVSAVNTAVFVEGENVVLTGLEISYSGSTDYIQGVVGMGPSPDSKITITDSKITLEDAQDKIGVMFYRGNATVNENEFVNVTYGIGLEVNELITIASISDNDFTQVAGGGTAILYGTNSAPPSITKPAFVQQLLNSNNFTPNMNQEQRVKFTYGDLADTASKSSATATDNNDGTATITIQLDATAGADKFNNITSTYEILEASTTNVIGKIKDYIESSTPGKQDIIWEHDVGNHKVDIRVLDLVIEENLSVDISLPEAKFAGGTGTAEEPFLIATAEHLNNLRKYLGSEHRNKYFKQIANINLGISPWNEGKGWEPIGDYELENNFFGKYDGNNFKIEGLYINRPDTTAVGLFGRLHSQGVVKNLKLIEVNITGGNYVGAVSGGWGGDGLSGSKIENVHVTGSVTGSEYVGGLVGTGSTIIRSSSEANVTGTNAGGLAGMSRSLIDESYAGGVIKGSRTGGLVGFNYYSTIKNSYSVADVPSGSGLIGHGYHFSSVLENAYAAGQVGGKGLIGTNHNGGDNYEVRAYWDRETTGQLESANSDPIYGITTVEMKRQITFEGWDFDEIWAMDEGMTYPYLQNNQQDPKPGAVAPSQKFAISANVTGGTADVKTNPANEAKAGETVTVNISNIEASKQFASIQVNNGTVATTKVIAEESYTFEMPAEAVMITVSLESSTSEPHGQLLDAKAGSDFIGVLYTRSGNIYYNQQDNEGNWGSEVKIGTGTQGRFTIDNADNSHVVYTTPAPNGYNGIGYRMYNGNTSTEVEYIVSNGDSNCSKPDIAVDSSGYVHITYTDPRGINDSWNEIMYASNVTGDFIKSVYNNGGSWDRYNDGSHITIDKDDEIHVLYILRNQQNHPAIWVNKMYDNAEIIVSPTIQNIETYDFITGDNEKIYALYKVGDNVIVTEFTISGGGTIDSHANVREYSGSANSLEVNNENIVVGGTKGSNLHVDYGGIEITFSEIEVVDDVVSIVKLNGKLYAFYTNATSGMITRAEIEAPQKTVTPTITTESQIVNTETIVIEGTAETSADVRITGGSSIATGKADGEGNYAIEVPLTLNEANTLSVVAQSEGKTESEVATVFITHQFLNSEAEILSYSITDQIGDTVIDSQAGTITVEVPYETDVSNLVATVITSEDTQSIKVGSVGQESGVTANDFSSLVTYVVTAEDGTKKEWVVTINVASNPDFAGGLGTEASPYEIATAEHLDNVRKYLGSDHANTHFILLNDIDLGEATSTASGTYWNDGKGWKPIGGEGNTFMGSLNGAGFSISDLYINRPEENDVGLFGVISKYSSLVYDPGVHNLTLEAGSVAGKDYVGPVAGRFVGQMSSVSTDVTVHGERYVGGLIGRATSGAHWTGNAWTDYRQRIENSSASGDVFGTQYVGGLLGHGGTRLTITNCSASGDVTGITGAVSQIGGFIGVISGQGGTSVSNSYATGNVFAPEANSVGGLSGSASQNSVSNSYATGNVEGNEMVGGLIGSSSISVSGNFATGDVVGNYRVGGLVGYSTTNISNAYSSGNISGDTKIGGIVGQIGWWPHNSYARTRDISDAYALGNVIGTDSNVGGLAGWMVGDVNNSYFTASVSGTTSNIGSMVGYHGRGTVNSSYYNQDNSQHAGGGIPKTTGEMKQEITYTDWDFSNIWGINSVENQGYPFLRWQGYDHISSAAEFEEFSFAEEAEPFDIDSKEGIITIKVGNGTDMTDLVATFSLSPGATAAVEGTQQESGSTGNDFSSPVIYVVTAEDGTTIKEWVVTVIEIDFAGGAGTEASPFKIETAEQLNSIRNYLGSEHENTYFNLVDDIDLGNATSSGGAYWNDGKGWEPIGDEVLSNRFMSKFNGGGFSIINLNINRPDEDYVGLFGYIGRFNSNPKIQNLNITGATVRGQDYTGILAGYNSGHIRDITVSGELFGNDFAGGLIGENRSNTIVDNAVANVNVSGQERVGGLIGNNDGAYIEVKDSSAHGKVVGSYRYIGGLVGFNYSSINASHATGDVEGVSIAGGLIGYSHTSNVENCYASGDVTGTSQIGGLVGLTYAGSGNASTVINCFALGNVKGEEEVGGIVGRVNSRSHIVGNYALNPEIIRDNNEEISFGRIGNRYINRGYLSENYANKNMIEPFLGAFNDKTPSTKDGGDLTSFSVDNGVLTVERTGSISGTITNSEDSPIEGATVSINVNGVTLQATTDGDGTYTIWNVPTGTGITISADKDGYIFSSIDEVTIEEGKQTGEVDFVLLDK